MAGYAFKCPNDNQLLYILVFSVFPVLLHFMASNGTVAAIKFEAWAFRHSAQYNVHNAIGLSSPYSGKAPRSTVALKFNIHRPRPSQLR